MPVVIVSCSTVAKQHVKDLHDVMFSLLLQISILSGPDNFPFKEQIDAKVENRTVPNVSGKKLVDFFSLITFEIGIIILTI